MHLLLPWASTILGEKETKQPYIPKNAQKLKDFRENKRKSNSYLQN